jgi:uroporphyrinogen-III synthase
MRVLVTRSQEDSERTAKRLAQRGHEALIAPTTRIVPTGEPQPAGPFDAVIVTSAHAAEALTAMAHKHWPVFAVGPHTALAAQRAGFRSVAAADGDARSLSGLIRGLPGIGRRLLHVTGRHHKAEPAESLRNAGFHVVSWEAYEAERLDCLVPEAIEAIRTGQIGAALHYSRRSADIFLQLAGEAGLTSSVGNFPHLCLSADVAAAFAGLGVTTVPSRRPDEEALLDLLDGLP